MSELATLQIAERTATLTLNRPDQRNALSVELLTALHARMDELEAAQGVSCCVLTGAGAAFCAGMDLKQVVIDASLGGFGDPDLPLRLLSELARFSLRLRKLPAVTVARVNGAAIGGGCGLTCVCDVSVSHVGATVGFPEVDLAICPAVVAPWVVKKIGAGRARAMLLKGGTMLAEEGHARGLIDVLAEDAGSLDEACTELVSRIAEGGPAALAATKSLVNKLDDSLDEDVLTRAAELSAKVLTGPEAQARLAERLKG